MEGYTILKRLKEEGERMREMGGCRVDIVFFSPRGGGFIYFY